MKKLTTIIAGIFVLFAASAFTPSDENVSFKIKTIFEQNFTSVSDVKWKVRGDICIALFNNEKNDHLAAAYNMDGELLCIGRSITTAQLPLNVSRALENSYKGYKINPEIIEVSTEVTSYVIYAENEKFEFKINADASGNLTVESKTKKKK